MNLVESSSNRPPWLLFTLSSTAILFHLYLAFLSTHGLGMFLFMLAMAAACFPCTVALLRSCSPRNLMIMMLLAATSAGVHAAILVSGFIGGSGGHESHTQHGDAAGHVTDAATGHHGVELVLLILLEVGVFVLAAALRARTVRNQGLENKKRLTSDLALQHS